MKRLVSAASAAVLGALAAIVLAACWYLLSPEIRIDFAVDPPRLVAGVHPAERNDAGLTFAWTGRDMAIRLPGLDRRVPWSARVRLRGGRQAPAENPTVVVSVDGIRVAETPSGADFSDITFTLPSRPDRPRGALVTMQVSSTFVPPGDPRALGVMLDDIIIAPDGIALPPSDTLMAAAFAGAIMAAAIAILGVTPGSAVLAAILIGAGQGAVLSRGFAPFTDYRDVVVRLAFGVGVATMILALAVEWLRGRRLRNTARFAAAFTAAALFLKLLVLLHPDMPIGDALFQAHRFQDVLRGNYYFTSIAPGNYLFPYAPGLYVAASPFGDLVRREMGDVALLRIFVASTDAAAALALYPIVVGAWGDRRAAAFSTALYHLLPLDFRIATGGTLTSAFAQSLAVVGLAAMTAPWVRLDRLWAVALLTATLLAAFLSHTSTFAVLAASSVAVAAMIALRGGRELRSAAAAVAIAGIAASALAVAIYYAHFMETYRTELARIGTETATAAADAGGRSIGQRAAAVPYYLNLYFGIPALTLTIVGVASMWRRGLRDRLTLALAGWSATCAAFLLLGVLTPVDMRYYVAALPAIAVAAAAGASSLWAAGGHRRLAAGALLGWCAGIGIRTWWTTLA